MAVNIEEILALKTDERLKLLDIIWGSLIDENEPLPISDDERRELERRYQNYLQDPSSAQPWSEVREELLGRREPSA